MKLLGPCKYDIEFTNSEGITSIKINGAKVDFSKPVTGVGAKVYVVSVNQTPVYVGATTQAIKVRLNQGLKAKYGYKWKDLGRATISVWMLEGADKMDMETVEGEVVFLIRQQCDKWPEYQNEIHFHESCDAHRAAARKIFNQLWETVCQTA